jgi:hypothetical protein
MAISFICKSYSEDEAAYIWSQWEPHFQLPPSHPLAELHLARDNILTVLQASCTAPEPTARDTQALTNLVSVAIPVETFIIYTELTLREEEMVTHIPFHREPIPTWLAVMSLTYGVLAAVIAMSSHLTGQRVVDPRWSHDSPSRLTLIRTSLQLATILSLISPFP